MKLGDTMAPIEACSVWNDVCPRKTRPPKIGDIPRHVAVDEESPGCSTSRSLGQFNEIKSPISMLERSTSCHIERSKAFGGSPVIKDILCTGLPTKNNEKKPENSEDIETKFVDSIRHSYNSNNTISIDNTLNGDLPRSNEISRTLTAKNQLDILPENPSLRVSKCTESRDDETTWESDIPEGIFEIRKDSALYIDDNNIESLTLRENILTRVDSSRSLKAVDATSLRDNIEQETGNSRVYRSRARRESSGYFSNLGTFDEDRWVTGTMDMGNQQDLGTRDISRERRRSSTKGIRLPTYNQQQSPIQSAIGHACGQQLTKINSLVCSPNSIAEMSKDSSTNDFTTIGKVSRIEMPNIAEQTSLELDKSINFDSRDSTEMDIKIDDIENHLLNKISQVSLGNSPTTNDNVLYSAMYNVTSNDEKADDSFISNDGASTRDFTKILSNSVESSSEGTNCPRNSGKQRRRMVVHQYSSPNMTNTELERIVEKPYGETMYRKNVESQLDDGKNEKLENTKVDEELENEDDDDHVVVARVESETNENIRLNETDTSKLLPRSVKVYQLLSTQSEDRGDGESRLYDRRISLQVTRHNDDETIRERTDDVSIPTTNEHATGFLAEDKKLVHADSVPLLVVPRSGMSNSECCDDTNVRDVTPGPMKILSSPGDSRHSDGERINVIDKPSGSTIAGIRPIYPYCPYSPYASPQGSPRTNRRRPLRESRRVSIDSRQGALQLNQYKLLNNIGQGSYGIVKLAYNEEDETHYAMKILSKKKLMKKAGIFGRIAPGRKGVTNPLDKVYREIALLKKLDHPNVVKLVEVLDDPDEDNLYLVFELVQKGEVLQLPTDKPLDEETARRHFRDVVMGVEYLHYQRIVHRDIKPSNLLVDSEGRVKVADLGVSAELRAAGELLSGSAGTPAFAAPETTTPGAQYSGTLCDVWSMGVTLYSLVTGKVPWDGAGSIMGVQAAVRSEQLRFPEKPCLTENLRDLVSRMLSKDPIRRINLAEIKEHCWLTNEGCEPLPNEADNCRLPVTVTDEEVARVVTRVPKLDTLILIKTMLKQHSFQNPFLSRRIVRSAGDSATGGSVKQQSSTDITDVSKGSIAIGDTVNSKTEQFHRAGRSNSAPDSYEWRTNGRQISSDSLLPPVTESSSQEAEVEKR